MTAGEKLRASMNDALGRAAKQLGAALVWTESERVALDAACRSADAVELLDRLIVTERAGEGRGALVAKLLSERRMQEKHSADMLARLSLGTGPAKSSRHQRAANARWGRRDAEWAAARDGGG